MFFTCSILFESIVYRVSIIVDFNFGIYTLAKEDNETLDKHVAYEKKTRGMW